jgi:hypothetical protein
VAKWRPFVYREFYDVPRALVVCEKTRCLLFLALFDDEMDEYRASYDVYELPNLTEAELKGSWENFEQKTIRKLGKVAVAEARFDETKRRQIDLEILESLVVKSE